MSDSGYVECPWCDGIGNIQVGGTGDVAQDWEECDYCHGYGHLTPHEIKQIRAEQEADKYEDGD